MGRHIITLDLSDDEVTEAVDLLTELLDGDVLTQELLTNDDALCRQVLDALRDREATADEDPVEVEFTPRSDRGEA